MTIKDINLVPFETADDLPIPAQMIYNTVMNDSGLDTDRITFIADTDPRTGAVYIGISYK